MTFAATPVMVGSADARIETTSQAQATTAKAEPKVSFSSLKQIDAGVVTGGYAEDGPPVDPPSFSYMAGRTTSTPMLTSRPSWHRRATA